jgi:hypothetical protein
MLTFVKKLAGNWRIAGHARTHKGCELQRGKEIDSHQPTVFLQISPRL